MSKKVYQEGVAIYQEYGFEKMELHFCQHLQGFTGDDGNWENIALFACTSKQWRLLNDILYGRETVLRSLLHTLGGKDQKKLFLELTQQPVMMKEKDPQLYSIIAISSLIKKKITSCDVEIFRWSFPNLTQADHMDGNAHYQMGVFLPYIVSEFFSNISDVSLKKDVANTLLGDNTQHASLASVIGPILQVSPFCDDVLKDILRHLDDGHAFSFLNAMEQKYPNDHLSYLDEVKARKLHQDISDVLGEKPSSFPKRQM